MITETFIIWFYIIRKDNLIVDITVQKVIQCQCYHSLIVLVKHKLITISGAFYSCKLSADQVTSQIVSFAKKKKKSFQTFLRIRLFRSERIFLQTYFSQFIQNVFCFFLKCCINIVLGRAFCHVITKTSERDPYYAKSFQVRFGKVRSGQYNFLINESPKL